LFSSRRGIVDAEIESEVEVMLGGGGIKPRLTQGSRPKKLCLGGLTQLEQVQRGWMHSEVCKKASGERELCSGQGEGRVWRKFESDWRIWWKVVDG
jgi:hypothetical protein